MAHALQIRLGHIAEVPGSAALLGFVLGHQFAEICGKLRVMVETPRAAGGVHDGEVPGGDGRDPGGGRVPIGRDIAVSSVKDDQRSEVPSSASCW